MGINLYWLVKTHEMESLASRLNQRIYALEVVGVWLLERKAWVSGAVKPPISSCQYIPCISLGFYEPLPYTTLNVGLSLNSTVFMSRYLFP